MIFENMNDLITVEDFHLGYGDEEVLHIESLRIKQGTITGLLGPSGGGKSSFLNAIMHKGGSLSYWEKGKIIFNGQKISNKAILRYVASVSQKARLYTDTILANFLDGLRFKHEVTAEQKRRFVEKICKKYDVWEYFESILDELAVKQSLGVHKMLLIIKAMIRKPKLLLLDEILASTSIKDELIIINLIKKLKADTSIILVTHNKEEAKDLCDSIALISGGVLHEHTDAADFFKKPKSETGQEFLESGSAWYFNPNKTQNNNKDNLTVLRRFSSICEFYWVVPNKLGGMQKPGLMTEIEEDLKIMKKLGVKVLVTLQQTPLDSNLLDQYDIEGLSFPIIDMGVPELEDTYKFVCKAVELIENGSSLIYHCKAGMGRTGTLLACNLLLLENISAICAIEKIRQVNYKYIQTEEQMEFVSKFEQYVKGK